LSRRTVSTRDGRGGLLSDERVLGIITAFFQFALLGKSCFTASIEIDTCMHVYCHRHIDHAPGILWRNCYNTPVSWTQNHAPAPAVRTVSFRLRARPLAHALDSIVPEILSPKRKRKKKALAVKVGRIHQRSPSRFPARHIYRIASIFWRTALVKSWVELFPPMSLVRTLL